MATYGIRRTTNDGHERFHLVHFCYTKIHFCYTKIHFCHCQNSHHFPIYTLFLYCFKFNKAFAGCTTAHSKSVFSIDDIHYLLHFHIKRSNIIFTVDGSDQVPFRNIIYASHHYVSEKNLNCIKTIFLK